MIACFACRNDIPDEAMFCPWCGAVVGRELLSPAPTDSVILGDDTATGRAIGLSTRARSEGLYVIGKQGTGKTSFLLNLMLQDAASEIGFCFIDPHGEAIRDLLRRLPEKALSKVLLLDVTDTRYPFGINFYEVADLSDEDAVDRRAAEAVGVFKKLWGEGEQASWGPRLQDLLHVISYTLIENPPYTLAEVELLLTNAGFREEVVSRLSNEVARSFWAAEYDPEQPREQRDHRASTVNKVRPFVLSRTIRRIIGQSHTTVDFHRCMEEGSIVLVNLAVGSVGDEVVNLLGSVIVGMVATAAFSRSDAADRPPFHLYADEYQRFATPAFARLLTEARKYNLATTTAHQNRGQLKREGATVATIAAANLVVFQVSGADGRELAVEFDTTPPPAPVPKEYIKQDVVEHLLHNGHPDPRLATFTIRYLQALDAATHDTITPDPRYYRNNYPEMTFGEDRYAYDPTIIRDGLRLINQFLYCVMQGRCSPTEDSWAVFPAVGARLGFGTIFRVAWIYEKQAPLARYLSARLYLASVGDDRGMLPHVDEAERARIMRRIYEKRAREDKLPLMENDTEVFAKREFDRALPFYIALTQAAEALAAEPIRTDSGMPHAQQGQRTFTDREEEIGNMLSHLPPRTARCKLRQADGPTECTMTTTPLPAPISMQEYALRVERIRKRNLRDGVLRERDAVEEEITRRQRKWRPAMDSTAEEAEEDTQEATGSSDRIWPTRRGVDR